MSVGFVIAWIAIVLVFAVIYRDIFKTPVYIPAFALFAVPVAIAYLSVLAVKDVPIVLTFLWTYLAFLVGIAAYFFAARALVHDHETPPAAGAG